MFACLFRYLPHLGVGLMADEILLKEWPTVSASLGRPIYRKLLRFGVPILSTWFYAILIDCLSIG